jgi:hypothetical protein
LIWWIKLNEPKLIEVVEKLASFEPVFNDYDCGTFTECYNSAWDNGYNTAMADVALSIREYL